MQKLKIKCPAKLNLSLDVLKKREDGYHELEMLMQTVDVCDFINISVSDGDGINLSCDNAEVPLNEKNTAYKAAELFYKKLKKTKKVDIEIEKNIPQGAGMAGGSADAAGVLKGLNILEGEPFSKKELLCLALKIGADVPFCVSGGAMLCKGVGEKMTAVEPMKNVYALILKPEVSVSTPWAYKALDDEETWIHPKTEALIKALEEKKYSDFGIYGGNTLEEPVFKAYPLIKELKEGLKERGAVYSLMTGSGAAVYGIFEDKSAAEIAAKEFCKATEKIFLVKL